MVDAATEAALQTCRSVIREAVIPIVRCNVEGIHQAMQHITMTSRERDTVLAALRYYQFYRLQGHPFDPRQDHLIDAIASTDGEALGLAEVDDLCAGLKGNAHALGVMA